MEKFWSLGTATIFIKQIEIEGLNSKAGIALIQLDLVSVALNYI